MIKTVHLIFKTHLDVGFTDLAQNVVERYFRQYIPQAVELARTLREAGGPDRFIWTTGSWLIYEYLEQAPREERAQMEQAILAGDIAWHALPFTTHSELLDADLFRFGLSLSQEMDKRFGKRTTAAKMTDVPGHTRGIVPLLAEAGVRFLHIGVNPASTPPGVPPVFLWRDPTGAEVMVMYHKGSYGEAMVVPGLDEAIAFAHTGDNRGPQSVEQVQAAFENARRAFPGAQVVASTLSDYAARLATLRGQLPVVTQEIGDTWIHGVGSDPWKVARFRELLRLRRRWLADGRVDAQDRHFQAFSRKLLLVPEHTWGLDMKTHLGDYTHYKNAAFRALRREANYRKMEASWREQRAYLDAAVGVLQPLPLVQEATEALAQITPVEPDPAGWEPLSDPLQTLEVAHFILRFDSRGALVQLAERASGREWAAPTQPLGLLRYETLCHLDYERFFRRYVVHKRQHASWAVPDFTRPGLAQAGAEHRDWLPHLERICRRRDPDGGRFLLELALPEQACTAYGCPRRVTVEWRFPDGERRADVELQWFGKQATRLTEALWFSFCPLAHDPKGWHMDKLGLPVSPLQVIRDGNRHLHAVGQGISYQDEHSRLEIETPDAALLAPGQRALLEFSNRQPVLREGVHFLLYANIYPTNFPLWYEDDARFRFLVRFWSKLTK